MVKCFKVQCFPFHLVLCKTVAITEKGLEDLVHDERLKDLGTLHICNCYSLALNAFLIFFHVGVSPLMCYIFDHFSSCRLQHPISEPFMHFIITLIPSKWPCHFIGSFVHCLSFSQEVNTLRTGTSSLVHPCEQCLACKEKLDERH